MITQNSSDFFKKLSALKKQSQFKIWNIKIFTILNTAQNSEFHVP